MSATQAVKPARSEIRDPSARTKLADDILVGKDILELVSGAMYIEPLTIVREYVQNAVDAIDEAESAGLYSAKEGGRVDIVVDLAQRRLVIRDNGGGLSKGSFAQRLTAFGGSKKRGTRARGFRGVGRLSGLGYCQELVFRSRSTRDSSVMEIAWDGRRFREILLDPQYKEDLNKVVREVTSLRSLAGTEYPKRFFEVELRGLARHKNDVLLNEHEIETYLCQVAPVPFHPDFQYGREIEKFLAKHDQDRSYKIFIKRADTASNELQVFRPYRSTFRVHGAERDRIVDVEFLEVPGIDGNTAAVGWTLHHAYRGAIPREAGIKGLRLRSGNIQVGGDDIAAEIFPEPRFNSWMIGELHAIAPKLVPNGRRDAFETNAHYLDLQNHIAAYAKTIAKTCREKSRIRNRERSFEIEMEKIEGKLATLARSSIPRRFKEKIRKQLPTHIRALERLIKSAVSTAERNKFEKLLKRIKARAGRRLDDSAVRDPLVRLPKAKQDAYRHIIDLIFDCAPNHNIAGALVARMLPKLTR